MSALTKGRVVDALVPKIREEGHVHAHSVMITIDVNTDGYREILGLMLGDSEYESSCPYVIKPNSGDLFGAGAVKGPRSGGEAFTLDEQPGRWIIMFRITYLRNFTHKLGLDGFVNVNS